MKNLIVLILIVFISCSKESVFKIELTCSLTGYSYFTDSSETTEYIYTLKTDNHRGAYYQSETGDWFYPNEVNEWCAVIKETNSSVTKCGCK